MIALLSFICLISVFIAGHLYNVHAVAGIMMLSLFALAQGVIIVAAKTRGFEGQRLVNLPMPLTWEKLWLNVIRMALQRGKVVGEERIYVQTPTGPVPATGVFTARINHEMGIVLDTETPEEAAHAFNALKQGVM
jgi:hypothetical protein